LLCSESSQAVESSESCPSFLAFRNVKRRLNYRHRININRLLVQENQPLLMSFSLRILQFNSACRCNSVCTTGRRSTSWRLFLWRREARPAHIWSSERTRCDQKPKQGASNLIVGPLTPPCTLYLANVIACGHSVSALIKAANFRPVPCAWS